MRLAMIAALVGTLAVALPLPAFAVQTGKIYKSAEGEWMCIDRWGNEIPPSSTGGWPNWMQPASPSRASVDGGKAT